MAMENLAITQHQNILWHAIICGGGYQPWVRRFKLGDYVYFQQTTRTTLDVTIGCVILRVQKVSPFRVLLLEG
jgi:hypothetical protein